MHQKETIFIVEVELKFYRTQDLATPQRYTAFLGMAVKGSFDFVIMK